MPDTDTNAIQSNTDQQLAAHTAGPEVFTKLDIESEYIRVKAESDCERPWTEDEYCAGCAAVSALLAEADSILDAAAKTRLLPYHADEYTGYSDNWFVDELEEAFGKGLWNLDVDMTPRLEKLLKENKEVCG